MNWYNEIDPKKAAWLRELIRRDVVAPGVVDERSIQSVRSAELAGYAQCHFFAGIGVWSYALRLAGWPDDRPVWTGSCPCQPFSAAGKREGKADERHLWPAWFRLIAESGPSRIFAEQVASSDGLAWLDDVFTDLEGAGYACGALDLCAAGIGAPHIRQRLYIVAESENERYERGGRARGWRDGLAHNGATGEWGHSNGSGSQGCGRGGNGANECVVGTPGVVGDVGDSNGERCKGQSICLYERRSHETGSQIAGNGPVNGFWRDAEWVWCRDGKYRPVEPGTFPLVARATARILRLRGYGDAICAPLAAEFIKAAMNVETSEVSYSR